jgi:tetratricopeptide (TPR) repeat protein
MRGPVRVCRLGATRTIGRPEEELLRHLSEAARLYHEALDLLPVDAVNDLAIVHAQLGLIYSDAGDLDRAEQHCREALQQFEQAGDFFNAALARRSLAIALLIAGCRDDAFEYAEAALGGFESYGERAGEEIERTRSLIAKIRGT